MMFSDDPVLFVRCLRACCTQRLSVVVSSCVVFSNVESGVVCFIRVCQFYTSRVVCICRGGLSHLNTSTSKFLAANVT